MAIAGRFGQWRLPGAFRQWQLPGALNNGDCRALLRSKAFRSKALRSKAISSAFQAAEQGRQSPRPCTPAIRQTQPPATGGFPQQKHFPDGPDAIRSQLNAPSRRIPAARPGKRFCLGVCDASSRSKPRSRSKAISFCLKAARAGPAVAPALHPRYPANTTARCAGALSKSVFLTDQARFAPAQRTFSPHPCGSPWKTLLPRRL